VVGFLKFRYNNCSLNESHRYLLPAILNILHNTCSSVPEKSLFDLGCGNGSVANEIHKLGFRVAGVDPSSEGIAMAKRHYPHLDLRIGSSYDDLKRQFGTFSYVMSLEVIPHVYDPSSFSRTICELLMDDGYAIISTPYHGYLKNLAIAAIGGFDNHVNPLLDDGYVKFWSLQTLRTLLEGAGLRSIEFVRVGRIPALARSMIAVARKKGE
jgi:2-polyprenyl-3-methyl-5-hydroxy-6-metoxy-1,4-benzoquinol methylase